MKPSAKERIEIFEQFFFRLHFHRTVTMREAEVHKMLAIADSWVGAHSDGNGERSERDIQRNITDAYNKLRVLP